MTTGNICGSDEEVKPSQEHPRAEKWRAFAPEIIGLDGKRPLAKDWQNWQGSTDYMGRLEENGRNFGLLGRHFPGVDIDISNPVLAGIARTLALEIIGPAPVRTRADSPKCLLMYRGDGFRKRRLEGRTEVNLTAWKADPSVKADTCVELLARGQQYAIDGRHPDGAMYAWDRQPSPWDLTEITADKWDTFIRTVADRLKRVANIAILKDGLGSAIHAGNARDQEGLLAPDPAEAIEAMRQWAERNGEAHADHYPHDKFVELCAAFRGSVGVQADELYDDFRELCPGGRDVDGNTEKTYHSFADVSIGWSRLCEITDYVSTTSGFAAAQLPDEGNAEAFPADPGATAREEMFGRYVRCGAIDRFFEIGTGEALAPKEFNARNRKVASFGARGEKSAEAIFINHCEPEKHTVYAPTYRPDRPPSIVREERDGLMRNCINVYRPSIIKPKTGAMAADAAPWLKLGERMFGREDEEGNGLTHVLNWAAHLVQHPGKKINHAPVLYSEMHGVGKDLFLQVFAHILGQHNCRVVLPDVLLGRFTDYLETQLIIVPEMMNFSRRDVENRLKGFLCAPPAAVRVDKKNQQPYDIPNIQAWCFTTNHDDALHLEPHDRRYWVWDCGRSGRMAPDEGRWISEHWYREGGAAAVAGYLLARDISKFNPGAPPPMTEIKQTMIKNSEPRIVRFLREQFEEGAKLEGRTVLVAGDVVDAAGQATCVKLGVSARKHVPAALKSEGFAQGPRVRLGSTREEAPKQLWLKDPGGLLALLGADRLREKYHKEKTKAENAEAKAAGFPDDGADETEPVGGAFGGEREKIIW
jgi:hypothetical protein